MKHLLILILGIIFLPLVFLALWIAFSEPGLLDAEDGYPVLADKNNTKVRA